MLVPSHQQGWAVEAANGQLIWLEGSVEEMAHRTDSTVQQQECFEIPRDFKTGYRALLVATQADWARGAVREIKCRHCLKAKFKKWGEYKRHCDCTEMNLLLIYFCDSRWDRCCECDRVVQIREERKRMGKRERGSQSEKRQTRERDRPRSCGLQFHRTIADNREHGVRQKKRGELD